MPKLQLKLLLMDDVIDGFSYSFSKALLAHLDVPEENWFESPEDLSTAENAAKSEYTSNVNLAPAVYSAFTYLAEQMKMESPFSSGNYFDLMQLRKIISEARAFLSIFSQKK